MTAHKHLKRQVRERMAKTGEGYASARRHVIRQAPPKQTDPATRWHFPGSVAAATALRGLIAHAGVRSSQTGEPFSEAMVFGIAGGIGIGIFSFYYQAADFASFYIAGRHNLQDDVQYLVGACERLGLKPALRESDGVKKAQAQLLEALAQGPCIAWVDMTHLPHRGLPSAMSGGGYHVVTVYRADPDTSSALIGDLTDEPISIALADLSQARARIKSFRNRLLSVPESPGERALAPLVREGLSRCHQGFLGGTKGPKSGQVNFTLKAIKTWADRMHGSNDKESWERLFPRGRKLWQGLTSIYQFIENYGTGGGLCRPIFAEFLTEAGEALKSADLLRLAEQYQALGRDWSALAEAALPDNVPAFREAKESRALALERMLCGVAANGAAKDSAEPPPAKGRSTDEEFPLSEAECRELRASLQARILALYDGELAAHAALGQALAAL
jgi:hypothetical protein